MSEMDCKILKTTYNNNVVGPSTDVEDIIIECNISDIELSRKIGSVTYYMIWENGHVTLSTDATHAIANDTTLADLKGA